MAYTSPRQWLDLLRRKPGARFTDLGPAGNVLDATGDFMQRNSANPGRDWRSILAEGEQRRQQSESYRTPGRPFHRLGWVGARVDFNRHLGKKAIPTSLNRCPGQLPEIPLIRLPVTYPKIRRAF